MKAQFYWPIEMLGRREGRYNLTAVRVDLTAPPERGLVIDADRWGGVPNQLCPKLLRQRRWSYFA